MDISTVLKGLQEIKIYLASLEIEGKRILKMPDRDFLWNLLSFYYLRKNIYIYKEILNRSKLLLIDSGAHSFQKGIKVNFDDFTHEYADFIKSNDNDKIVGFFEMDVDNIIGYDKVLELRKILEKGCKKIIPVWHKNRGIKEFVEMCKEYKNKYIAITGFRNEDIKDNQYIMFLKEAKKYNCMVHCLGMTRWDILKKIPFDSVDSSSWVRQAVFGKVVTFLNGRTITINVNIKNTDERIMINYEQYKKAQLYYFDYWDKRRILWQQ